MSLTTTIDLAPVAQGLGLALERVENVVRLLDADNTVPFITRYRKDQTGGLDEVQIRRIEAWVTKLRLLAERKLTILRSIDSQGKLTPELAAAINAADGTKRLEDLYLPYKPKKQSLATLARERQLEPFAKEILSGAEEARDLDARAKDFINPDKQVASIADVLLGVGYILAEDYSERADLREKLRRIFKKTGRIVSVKIESEKKPDDAKTGDAVAPVAIPEVTNAEVEAAAETVSAPELSETLSAAVVAADNDAIVEDPITESSADAVMAEDAAEEIVAETEATPAENVGETQTNEAVASEPATTEAAPTAGQQPAPQQPKKKDKSKGKKSEKKPENPIELEFRDYFQYSEQLTRVPPHRVLALNRGERAKVIRIRVEADLESMYREAETLLVPADHIHADFLKPCVRDALTRLVIPSLERELRRELTETAETHAVDVFAKNLRNLLLVAPVRNRKVLALDPGFKSGCKIAVLDEFGNLLDHGVIHIIGKAERKAEGRAKVVEWIKKHSVTLLAIGNGTACRETEEFAAEILGDELKDEALAYMIVNEAGASVYSTSQLGREEFPTYDATLRGAISIGRRMLDPLSELVKIDPANLGVGLYQHDVKAKHLRASLDAVVESCVNYVGVDLNTASPALLRYVSGLNQLKSRQIYEYRSAHGPFKSREQLKEVPGFGDATFVQAAGFLKIVEGENPLDATWIHPESYPIARTLLGKLEKTEADLATKETTAAVAEQVKTLETAPLAGELGVGELSLGDILTQLTRPGRDPREDLPPPIFRRGILKLEDLDVGMELTGSVLNVVDFGAFVDIGLHDSGLVHVSQIANRFVKDPHELVSVGDIVKVWVMEIDKGRRRVSLTMIAPGTKRFEPQRGPRKDRREGQPAGEGGQRPPRGDRPPRGPRPQGAPQGAGQSGPVNTISGGGYQGHDRKPGGEAGAPRGDRPPRTGGPGAPKPAAPRSQNMVGPPVETFGRKPGSGTGKPFQRKPGGPGGSGGGPGAGGFSLGGGKKFGGGGGRGAPRRDEGPRSFESQPKKEFKPLTDEMKKGKVPLRTFGDLLQFVKKEEPPVPPETKKSDAGDPSQAGE